MGSALLRPVLVLDAGYQAVNVVPLRRALRLISAGKAAPVEADESILLRSEKLEIPCPVIIRLFIAVAHRVYATLRVRFNKRNIMARDGFRCQYCGSTEDLTIDHVVPRSRRTLRNPRGGETSWENCVTACLPCNLRKGDRTPEEAGMTLRSRPHRPRWNFGLLHRSRDEAWSDRWRRFLSA